MKKSLFVILLSAFPVLLMSQDLSEGTSGVTPSDKRAAVTVGLLQGGGSLVGFDFEYLVTQKIGLQAGLGYIGFGGGINFHLMPAINSSFISLAYWHQGIGETFAQDALGGVFTFRARKLLSASLGLGIPLSRGPALDVDFEQPPVMLLYSIGIYLPF
jgi:hypothetical protein